MTPGKKKLGRPTVDESREFLHTSIYALVDPRTEEIRYVGRTTSSLRVRLTQHRAEARSWLRYEKAGVTYGGKRKNLWVLDLLGVGLSPSIRLLEQVRVDDSRAEQRWWRRLKRRGVALTNRNRPPLS